MNYLKNPGRRIRHITSSPFIFSVFVPVIIADVWIEIYHRICFRLYKLPYIVRSKYVRVDHQKLAYLNPMQKLFCLYCGYVNGVFAYWVQIAAATETYWCGIQHEKVKGFVSPKHHKDFVPYGDEEAFRDKYKNK